MYACMYVVVVVIVLEPFKAYHKTTPANLFPQPFLLVNTPLVEAVDVITFSRLMVLLL